VNARRRILAASLGALLLAAAVLFAAVLPAEYGFDPLGTGAALGLTGLAQERGGALAAQGRAWRADRMAFELAPFEAVEYKYRLESGAAMLFTWRADGEVLFDLHAEPDGAAPGYAESFAKARGRGGSGTYTAPFPGIHGWFWQNRGQATVTVTLTTAGFFTGALESRDGREFEYVFETTETAGTTVQP